MAPEKRREQLLDGVLQVIVDHGVHKVSIDTVARQVGVTRPVIYGLFTDSNHLLRASLDRENDAALAQIGEVFRQAEPSEATERIPTLVGGFLDAAREAPQRWRAILVLADANTPAFRKRLERGRRALTDTIETLLRTTRSSPALTSGRPRTRCRHSFTTLPVGFSPSRTAIHASGLLATAAQHSAG
jgi:AcrR family transcriptional regulator